jgi:hypothetical protein
VSLDNLRFISGKVLIIDKIKQKQDWVNFSASVASPSHLRIDAYLGLLSIPLGRLVIVDNQALFVNYLEKKAYKTAQGSVALEKLLKTPISPRDINALFSEKFPLGGGWQCGGEANSQRCVQKELQIDWALSSNGTRTLQIESPKAKISFSYELEKSGKTDFAIKEPSGYKVIEL